jgi:hypothetical protein
LFELISVHGSATSGKKAKKTHNHLLELCSPIIDATTRFTRHRLAQNAAAQNQDRRGWLFKYLVSKEEIKCQIDNCFETL